MKSQYMLLLLLVVSVFIASQGRAEELRQGTAYLSDTIKITLRAGPGMDHKIVALLIVGQKIEVLEPGEEWTHIRAATGKEGWILSSFISKTPPNSMTLKQVQGRMEELSEQCGVLETEKSRLTAENETLKETITSGSGKADKRIEALAQENKLLRDSLGNRFIKWFLAGAGVLLLGFFLGYQSKRERRRLY